MKRIGDLGGVREHGVEDSSIGTGEIECGVVDSGQPVCALRLQPCLGLGPLPARDHIQELASIHINDLGRVALGPIGALTEEEHLVEAEGGDFTEATGQIDQGFAIEQDGIIDGVPAAAQGLSDLADASGVATDLLGDPASSPVEHQRARMSDPAVLLGPRSPRTVRIGTAPPALDPEHVHPAEAVVHIGQPNAAPALGAGQHSAARTADEDLSRLDGDRHLEPFDLHVQDVDMVETDQELAHARRVRSHGGSPVFRRQEPSDWQGPRLISGIQDPPHPRRAGKPPQTPRKPKCVYYLEEHTIT